MAITAQQFAGLKSAPLSHPSKSSSSSPSPSFFSIVEFRRRNYKQRIVSYAVTNYPKPKERIELKELFQQARDRCLTSPMDGVSFTPDDFHSVLEKYDFSSEIGAKVRGTVFMTDVNGALVDITAKSSAYLPLQEACLYRIKRVEEAGIVPGMQEEFVIIDENEADDSLILSLRSIQIDLAWERCRQLQAEDVVVKGKVISANKGGVVVLVEGIRGFVPFSQISTKSQVEELLEKELSLKFVDVDEENSRLVLSNRKATAESQEHLGTGSVVTGTVHSLQPYGAFIDIGGMNGLLHVSQISHDRVSDIASILQPGDTLKVMILNHDRERGRISLSTKKLEPTPGDMIRNPELVFQKAEEMAQTFRQRIAQAEALARADLLKLQPQSENGLTISTDGILEPLSATSLTERQDRNYLSRTADT